MFAISLLSIGLALAAPQGGGGRGANPAPDATVVEISARLIQADGKPSAGASKSGADDFGGYLWSNSQCAVGGGESAPSAATGWKFNTNIVRHLADSVTVQVVWQRVGDQQNQGTIDRTMRVGDRVQIDRIDLGTTSCASAVQLEATVLRSSASTGNGVGRGGFGGARGGRGTGSDVSGAGTAAGAARARGSQDPQSLAAQEEMRRKSLQALEAARAARVPGGAAGGRGGLATGMYTAELWLVHTVPNTAQTTDVVSTGRGGRGTGGGAGGGGGRGSVSSGRATPPSEAGPGEVEKVTYQLVRFAPTGAGFALPPVSVATSKGPASIVVMGTLSATVENGAPTKLVVTVNRQAMGSEQPAGTTGRSSTKEVPWPQNGEVISFELPPTAADTQEKLAIRLRVFSGMPAGAGRGRAR